MKIELKQAQFFHYVPTAGKNKQYVNAEDCDILAFDDNRQVVVVVKGNDASLIPLHQVRAMIPVDVPKPEKLHTAPAPAPPVMERSAKDAMPERRRGRPRKQ